MPVGCSSVHRQTEADEVLGFRHNHPISELDDLELITLKKDADVAEMPENLLSYI
jgi:hypothetical protein